MRACRAAEVPPGASLATDRVEARASARLAPCRNNLQDQPASSIGDVTAMRTVDAAEFRDAMEPTVNALRAFANAVDDLEQRSSPPAHESRAMSEIAAEQPLSERSEWKDPLSVIHGNGPLTLRAA